MSHRPVCQGRYSVKHSVAWIAKTLIPRQFLRGAVEPLARALCFIACGKSFYDLAVSLPVVDILSRRLIEIESDAHLAVAVKSRVVEIIITQVMSVEFC